LEISYSFQIYRLNINDNSVVWPEQENLALSLPVLCSNNLFLRPVAAGTERSDKRIEAFFSFGVTHPGYVQPFPRPAPVLVEGLRQTQFSPLRQK
jgi:hypothetical protein